MDKKIIVSELIKIAKSLVALEFETKKELEDYKKKHDVRPGTKLKVAPKKKDGDKPTRKGYTGDMHKDLKILLPNIIADGIGQNREESNKLVSIAEKIYKENPQWASRITDTNKGRDTLHAFMQHWYDAYKKDGKWIDE